MSGVSSLPEFLNSTVFMNDIPSEFRQKIEHLPLKSLYPILLHPLGILGILAVYVYGCTRPNLTQHKIKIPFFNGLVALHNFALAAFSIYTFLGATPIWVNNVLLNSRHDNFKDAWCDREEYTWNDGIYWYSWLFYLSKFYELIDTGILILKRKNPSFLQVYHHTGALFCCFLGMYTRATGGWIFLIFNSFIHSIMYTYFFITSFHVKFPMWVKSTLTQMQIAQFLVGGAIGMPYFFISNCRKHTRGELFTFFVGLAYLVPLTRLFINFAIDIYGWGKDKKIQDKGAVKVD